MLHAAMQGARAGEPCGVRHSWAAMGLWGTASLLKLQQLVLKDRCIGEARGGVVSIVYSKIQW